MFEHLRELHSEVYVTSFPDGTDVPWKPLSYGDFVRFSTAFQSGEVLSVKLEDDVFRIAVLNKALVQYIDELPAGIVSTVVTHIMNVSGPDTIDAFNQKLEDNRVKSESPLHMIVTVICRAFPAYTPEIIYSLDYETVMLRLAQAERLLLDAQIIAEPIALYKEGEGPQQQKTKEAPPEVRRAWEQSMKMKNKLKDLNPPGATPPIVSKPTVIEKPEKKKASPLMQKKDGLDTGKMPEGWDLSVSPVLQKRANIDISKENKATKEASRGAVSGWDLIDEPLIRQQHIEDAKIIYKDLLAKLAREQAEKKKG